MRTKLMISFILLVVVPLYASNRLLHYLAAQNIRENTTFYIKLFSDQVSSNLDSYFSELDRMTKSTLTNTEVCDALRKAGKQNSLDAYFTDSILFKHVLDLSIQQPNLDCVILISQQGKQYLSGISKIIHDNELFAQSIPFGEIDEKQGGILVAPAHIPAYLFDRVNSRVFSVSRQIRDEHFHAVGTVVLLVDCSTLIDVINVNPALTRTGAYIVVTNDRDEIIADTRSDSNPAETVFSWRNYADNSGYITYNSRSEYSGLSVSVIIPAGTLYESVNRFGQHSMLISALLIFAILGIALYLSYLIVKPVKNLQNTADAVRCGNLDIHTDIHTTDEIGSLAQSFDMMIDKIKDLVENVYLSQIRNKQSQLEALQHQINPHFLYNTLESIRMKAVLNKDMEVAQMTKTLGWLFRITLDLDSNIVRVKDEIEHVRVYVDIQNMRYDGRFTLNVDLPEDVMDCPMIKLVFQPIVENSIIHGYENNNHPGMITILGAVRDGRMEITIHDDGDGIGRTPLAALNESLRATPTGIEANNCDRGIGLHNISQRLKLEYGVEVSLSLQSETGTGTTVTIVIPVSQSTGNSEVVDGKL